MTTYYVPKPGASGQHTEDYNPQVYKDGTAQAEGWLTPEEFAEKFPPPMPEPPTLEEARESKWQEIVSGQASIMAEAKTLYPQDEREGWPFKLPEAEAILAGRDTPTPYIDAEFAGSGGLYASKTELAAKIVENSAKFSALSGFINGQQTAMYYELEDLMKKEGITAAQILAMPVEYVLPEEMQEER